MRIEVLDVIGSVDRPDEEQKQIITIFYERMFNKQPPPTIREIQKIMDYSSTDTAQRRLIELQNMGILDKPKEIKGRTWHLKQTIIPIYKHDPSWKEEYEESLS